MRRATIGAVAAVVAGLGALAGCGVGGVGVSPTASGKIVSETRQIQGFDAVDLSGAGKLILTQSATESVVVEADDNAMPLVTTELSGRTLRLSTKNGLPTNARVTYKVGIEDLTAISVSGAGDVTASAVDTPSLKLEQSGAGNITAAGQAGDLDVDISGAGDYDGADLAATTARVSVSGAGNAVVKVERSLDARVSGAGSIEYIGNPSVNQQTSGAGSIKKRS